MLKKSKNSLEELCSFNKPLTKTLEITKTEGLSQ